MGTRFLITIFITTALMLSYFLTNFIIDKVKNDVLDNTSLEAKKLLQQLIIDKQNNTTTIASLLANSGGIKRVLKGEQQEFNLKRISKSLRDSTKYKNVWFQIIDKNGISLQRSWINKKGDSLLNARMDVVEMIKNPRKMETISTGKFDMTFKSMFPVFDNNEYLGHIDVITHFNSISKEMRKLGYEMVVLVDKRYKKQLTKPFTKTFVKDYYVANLDAKKSLRELIEKKGVENFLVEENFQRIDNNLVSTHIINDLNNLPMGYFVIFKDIKSINFTKVDNIKKTTILIIAAIVLIFLVYFFTNFRSKKRIEKQSNYYQTILNLTTDILVVSDTRKPLFVNSAFFTFFNDCKDLEEFEEKYSCVCATLQYEDGYLPGDDKSIEWEKYLDEKRSISQKVVIKTETKRNVFLLKTIPFNKDNLKDTRMIMVLTDINEIENYQNNLEKIIDEKVKEVEEKDKILIQNSKTKAMGEIVNTIAHQWRQPLNSIGLEVEVLVDDYLYDELDKNSIEEFRSKIMGKLNYLSNTIENFMNFFNTSEEKRFFNIVEVTHQGIDLLSAKIDNSDISVSYHVETKGDCFIYGNRNLYIQVVHNIITNSIEAIAEHKKDLHGEIVIEFRHTDNTIDITFKDNGIGISDNKVLEKIFQPYFSTKSLHGTGIGMFMCKNIIENQFNGTVKAHNIINGFEVNLKIPLSKPIVEDYNVTE